MLFCSPQKHQLVHIIASHEPRCPQVEGVVKEGLPSAMFRVEVGATGKVVLCTISGRIRKNFVRILVGDPVRVELSPYDLTRGRITFRYK